MNTKIIWFSPMAGKEEARLLPGIFRTDEPVFNVPRLGKIT